MPKRLIEINKFTGGIISTPSATDTDEQSAKYSLNIDPQTSDGRLQGIDSDKYLTSSGFSNTGTASVVDAVKEIITVPDKFDSNKVNLIIGKGNDDNVDIVNTVSIVKDLYGDFTEINNLETDLNSIPSEYDFQASEDKVYIGLGGGQSNSSKVIMNPSGVKITGEDKGGIGLFDAELKSPNTGIFSSMYSEFLTFPIHGNTVGATALSQNDSEAPVNKIFPDYDMAVTINNAVTLYNTLNNSGVLDGLKVGQIFKCANSTDTNDNALLAWKKYDYAANATLEAHDLFMFCGYIADETYTDVPVLRFVGNANTQLPAFTYAIKDEGVSISKISLAKTPDATAFPTSFSANNIKGSSGPDYLVANTGNRSVSINLDNYDSWLGGYISAFGACSSPPLYNSIGLADSGNNPHRVDGDTFYNNGNLKILYRHGVFYVANKLHRDRLYRVNAIDFHSLTKTPIAVEDISLNFSRIPDQLHAENGKGIVRRTIEDQLLNPPEDPKQHAWSNIPNNAEIIGICETFDCGKLESVENKVSQFTTKYAFKFTTTHQSRLTTGDKVRFCGMGINADDDVSGTEKETFNTNIPYEVSVVDDGDAFYIDAESVAKVPAFTSDRTAMWWNCKVWILYGKKTNSASFDKWDLFLYNANTLDITSGRSIYMADRTPPFQQARYYTTSIRGQQGEGKLWYPGQFAFIKRDPSPGYSNPGTDDEEYANKGLQPGDVALPKSSVSGSGDSGNFCEWGIYDKAGRWSNNGTYPIFPGHNSSDYPVDWVGGYYGPGGFTSGPDYRITGDLIFGQNIGWSIDENAHRQVKPTHNSLHPLVPYSTLYNGNLAYPGYNSSVHGSNWDKTENGPSSFSGLSRNHNRPKHAVTFIGKVKGTFVVQPQVMSRQPIESSDGDEDISFNDNTMDLAFEIKPDMSSKLKVYNDDYTLFTIDDFSGHRGSVRYEHNDNSLDLSLDEGAENRVPKAGVDLTRPNFGGPEIENPIFKETQKTISGKEVGSLSSVNGGYSAELGDVNDKGWDGYTPPYIFNPGSGYYTYINRTWQSMSDISGLNNQERFYNNKNWFERTTHTWGFNSTFSTIGRFNNFSTTCLSDNFINRSRGQMKNTMTYEPPYPGDWTSVANPISTRFYSVDGPDTSELHDTFKLTFNTMPSNAQAVCTMHKLNISNFEEINNIFPIILNSTVAVNNSGGNKEFVCGYICGVNRTSDNGSAIAIIRTNFDSVWSNYASRTWSPSNLTHDGWILKNRMFTNHSQSISLFNSDPLSYVFPVNRRGTHHAEVMNISDTETNHEPNDSNVEGLQMFQANIDTYDSNITGNKIVVLLENPMTGFTAGQSLADADFHTWVQTNSKSNSNLYLGYENELYTRATGSTYSEDLNGSFFDGNEIFTGAGTSADATILTSSLSCLTFQTSTEGSDGNIVEGDYYYKLAFEYDDIYQSPLTKESTLKVVTPSTPGNVFDYIRITISLPSEIQSSIPTRATGLCVYRKYEGGDDDAYSLVDIVKFSDNWIYSADSDSYKFTINDKDTLRGTYFANNGIDETLENTSLNYGLSSILQGYLFVTKAFHPNLQDVKRYIFRSQPDNFFSFNWIEDFVIMPETPIAMVSFNSRLYVWGQNALYKLDPFSMLIEDTYEGVSIINKDSFVKTEYGLCFMDKNNVYIHDGNKPVAIADPILYSSNDSVVYNTSGTDGYVKLQQGYRELIEQTITNGHKPHITYSGKHNSFLVHLSDASTDGKTFAFNLNKRRWDLWDSPKPYAITTSKDSDIIIADGDSIYNYIKLESEEFTNYNRRTWDWFSKDINFGTDTQDKVFRSIKFLGTPSIYNNDKDALPAIYNATSNNKITSVQAYVDNDLVELTVKDKFYETINLGGTYLAQTVNSTTGDILIQTQIVPLTNTGANTSDETNKKQNFIQPGHLIKIDNEIMLVTSVASFPVMTQIYVTRGVMGTTAASHYSGITTSIDIVSPILKFPAGTKGKNLSIRLTGQKGYIDSVGVVYKPKSIK